MMSLFMSETETQQTVLQDWNEIQAMFKVGSAMLPNMAWFNGISSRLGSKRVPRLMGSHSAKCLRLFLDKQTDKNIKTLRTYAAINQEQVASAFKVTLFGNISIPILLLTLFHQLSDGALAILFRQVYNESPTAFWRFVFGGLFIVVLFGSLAIYALANLNQARDIRHLIDIYAAERGIYFGLEDMDNLSLN